MGDLKQQHVQELIQVRASMYQQQKREAELLAILATFEAIEAQRQHQLRQQSQAAPEA